MDFRSFDWKRLGLITGIVVGVTAIGYLNFCVGRELVSRNHYKKMRANIRPINVTYYPVGNDR